MSSGLFYTPQIVEDFATYLLENEFEGDMDDEFNELLDMWLDGIIYDTDEYLFHNDRTNDMALIKYIVNNDSMGLADCLFELMKDDKMGIQLCRVRLRSWAFYTVIREELVIEIEKKFNKLKNEKHTCDKCNHFEKDEDDIHYPENWTKKYPMGYKLCSDCVNEDEEEEEKIIKITLETLMKPCETEVKIRNIETVD